MLALLLEQGLEQVLEQGLEQGQGLVQVLQLEPMEDKRVQQPGRELWLPLL